MSQRRSSASSPPSLKRLAQERLLARRETRLAKTLEVVKPWVPHPPSPKQKVFLGLEAEEALFGGAAGGGKSDALLMAALQYVDVPGYAAGIFRLTKSDMLKPDAILARATAWLAGTRAWWDEAEHAFKFPTAGAPSTLHFGYVQHIGDLDRYQGAAFQFCGIDEAGQWTEYNYRYLFSRLRRVKSMPVPVRMRATANPGGKGHEWVKRRFIEYARHVTTGSDARGDIRAARHGGAPLPEPAVYASPPSAEAVEAARAINREAQPSYFVPSFKEDNTGLDVEAYAMQLARLDPVTRKQLDEGDWDAAHGGNFFKPEWFKIVEEAPSGLQWIRSWDMAATEEERGKDPDWTVGTKMAVEVLPSENKGVPPERRLWIADVERFREEPGPTEKRVEQMAKLDGRRVTIVIEQEPGSAGKSAIHGAKTRTLFGYNVVGMRKTGPKEEYWKPVSSLAHAGNVYLVRGAWNEAFIRELKDLPGVHDDQADTVGQGFAHLVDEKAFAMQRTRATASM
jgi:predicted phage terminase large subunit-like protein